MRQNWVQTAQRRVAMLVLAAATFGSIPSAGGNEPGAFPLDAHVEQLTIADQPFATVFGSGDKLFNAHYNSVDGAGVNLSGDDAVSIRFSRVPRPDLPGFRADPFRGTGPNAQSCVACHNQPADAGAGGLEANGIRDPRRLGDPAQYIIRNPLHLFGSGALQRLAEEATSDLKRIQGEATARAQSMGADVSAPLITANGVNYGTITVSPSGAVNTSQVRGVDPDLVVKPYFWKGELASFLRALVRGSAQLELGMQPVELVGPDVDADFDGVANEFSVGDITAMTMYVAAQPRPVTKIELSRELGGKHTLTAAQVSAILQGEKRFQQIGCAECHRPTMVLKDSLFQEPSGNPYYRDAQLISGGDPSTIGLDPSRAVKFDLASNPTVGRAGRDNRNRCLDHRELDDSSTGFVSHTGNPRGAGCFPQFESNGRGGILVHLYGDLKRHDMGPALADAVDEIGTGVSMWKTRELWGAGSTGPWLHDGRATTLTQAIQLHGGESKEARDRFASLDAKERDDIVNFLKNLVLFK